jgi:transposase-like protein
MFPLGNRFNTINHTVSNNRSKFSDFIIDETQVKVGHNYFWIWIAIKSDGKTILDNYISSERNMLIVEVSKFINKQIRKT